MLSPEELEEIRQKYPATKRDKDFIKPIVQNTPPKGEKRMGKFSMTEAEFKAARAAGKTIAQISKENDVTEATVYKQMNKWTETPKETQLPRDKEAQPPVNFPELYKKAQQEIEELRAELDQTATGRDEYKRLYEEQFAFAQEYFKQNELLKARADGAVAAREAAELDLEQATKDFEEQEEILLAEITELRGRAGQVPEPATDVHLLDRSIADLTRAKWILDRLSAAGE